MNQQHTVQVGPAFFSNKEPLAFIAGPCQLETVEQAYEIAETLATAAKRLCVDVVFKASFDKANRTSIHGARGMGLEASIPVFREIKARYGLPVLTDVHTEEQCAALAGVVDCLQIPALLCRQTDLLVAAARTGLPVNIKKGQFMAPWDMAYARDKIEWTEGHGGLLLTERGTSFGYNNLVVDMRSLSAMKRLHYPVIFDATHSVQLPGGNNGSSGGQREYVEPLARAAVATRIAGIFIETHPDPDNALSDGPNMIPLHRMLHLMHRLIMVDDLVKSEEYNSNRIY